MPILYALVKSTNGDIEAAHENINEGKITWKSKDPEGPKMWSTLTKHQKDDLLRIVNLQTNGFDHNRIISVNDKPEDSGSDSESRKSLDIKVTPSIEKPPTPRECDEEAKDLSINSTLYFDKHFYEKMFPINFEEYRKSFESARTNYRSVSSLVAAPAPNLMYADQERQAEFNYRLLNYYFHEKYFNNLDYFKFQRGNIP